MSWESASLHCLYRALQVLKLVLGLHLIKNPNMGRWENRKVYVYVCAGQFRDVNTMRNRRRRRNSRIRNRHVPPKRD